MITKLRTASALALGFAAVLGLCCAGWGDFVQAGAASDPVPPAGIAISSTVSREAHEGLRELYRNLGRTEPAPASRSPAEWKAYRTRTMAAMRGAVSAASVGLPASWKKERLGGVDVLRFSPRDEAPRAGRVLIYIHGGAYTLFSADACLPLPALVSAEARSEVLSVDYTLAPEGDPMRTTGEVLAVYRALLRTGLAPSRIGIFGDSAGGGLAAASILRMRDEKLPLPGALVLLSPWTDISGAGDTAITLQRAEPLLQTEMLRRSAAAYAPPAQQRSPYASPVYGDYDRGFVPTLIQAGTREILLSDSVRQYQAISAGGTEAVLDIYEGMPHIFQGLIPNSPEAKRAFSRMAAFFERHLEK